MPQKKRKETQSVKRIDTRKLAAEIYEQRASALQAIMDNITANYARLAQPTPLRNVYVATTGSDATGTGTSINPWKTLLFALNQANSLGVGTRINVAPGSYIGAFNPDGINGSSAAPIEMVCSGADFSAESMWGMDAANLNYVRFKGMSFRGNSDGTNPNSHVFSGGAGAENVAINSNRFSSSATASHVEFLNCQFHRGNRSNVLLGANTSQVHFISCRSHHAATTAANAPSSVGTGAGLDHGYYISKNANDTLIMNGLIYRNMNGYGISTYPGCARPGYISNTVSKNGKGGIGLSSGSYDNITFYAITSARVYNNIVSQQIARGTYSFSSAYGILTFAASGAAAPTGTADYNIVYGDASFNNSTSSPFVWGSNNKQVDPLFNDYANEDFRLKTGSPAIGMALAEWSPNFDVLGTARV